MNYSENVRLDFVKRTKSLLESDNVSCYEVTHMINLGLGLIVIPREDIKNTKDMGISSNFYKLLNMMDFNKAMTTIADKKFNNVDLFIKIRNGIAHGDIKFATNSYGDEIQSIKIIGVRDGELEKVTFEFSIEEFKNFAINIAEIFIKSYESIEKGN